LQTQLVLLRSIFNTNSTIHWFCERNQKPQLLLLTLSNSLLGARSV